MRNVKSIKGVKGQTVLLRVDFNVPITGGQVSDDFRIVKALPTIKFLTKKGAKVVLIAHLGKGGQSLELVASVLNKFITVKFVRDILGDEAQKIIREMKNGEVVLLENLRNDLGEQSCNKIFALSLSKLADIYVNDAFSVSHREDASIVLLPKLLPAYAGLQLQEEVENLSRAFQKPLHPFLFILGGAKFSTKIPLIKKYLKLADQVFIGGALANDFFKAEGYEVGDSLVDKESYGLENFLKDRKLILPMDVITKSSSQTLDEKINQVQDGENIIDIGQESIDRLAPLIKKAKLIVWNGPLGKYEEGGGMATEQILKLVANSKAESIIGGGDTVAIISKLNLSKKFSFISTGGGATLDFLANGTLPGIEALN